MYLREVVRLLADSIQRQLPVDLRHPGGHAAVGEMLDLALAGVGPEPLPERFLPVIFRQLPESGILGRAC